MNQKFLGTGGGSSTALPGTRLSDYSLPKLASGERWRLHGCQFDLGGIAATAGGATVTATIRDAGGNIYAYWVFWVPAASATIFGGAFSPWIDFGPDGVDMLVTGDVYIHVDHTLSSGKVHAEVLVSKIPYNA